MSNFTSTTSVPSSTSSAAPSPSTSTPPLSTPSRSSSIANTTPSSASSFSSSAPPSSLSSISSTSAPPTSSSSSTPPTSSTPSSSSSPPSSTTPPLSTSTEPGISSSAAVSFVTFTPTGDNGSSQSPIVIIKTSTAPPTIPTDASVTSSAPSSTSSDPGLINGGGSGNSGGGLSGGGKTAVEVIVPIAGVALIALGALFLWRRRKQRKDAEELRRKEVEEYGYNPNDDPTLPPVGGVAAGSTSDGPFEMREEGQGYRGWGATSGASATAPSSSARKASTTMSGGGVGMAYSEGTSPSQAAQSETRSGDPLVRGPDGRPLSGGEEALGAMGPAAASNRAGDVHRGPSNASSSYSAANHSEGSGDGGVSGGAYGQAQYYAGDNNFAGPYADGSYGGGTAGRAEMTGQPVIRDNLARRATRIENPSHFPTQASAGISQNF